MSINSSDGGIDQVVDRLLELAVMGRFAIYSDIDGTISPIAATPDAARLFPGAAEALRALRSRGIRVVAITGRAAEDARQLVGIDTLDYAGNHGFELLTADGRVVSEEVQSSVDAVEQALEDVRQVLEYLPDGLILENKVFTASIHYRLAPDRDVAALILRPLLESIALRRGVLITEGRLVFEIRPRLDVNKGVFTENDIRLHAITSAAFLGDDITDLDGFRALDRLVESGELLGAAK
ncbi:MAG: trehalose-phosphatase, partial [Chloroflexota bacterium]|nr:trehalose-phosphatase [Chloroflexota bacterium]